MGYYIETNSPFDKAQTIAEKYQGQIIPKPKSFSDIPEDKGLICVVDNVIFEAAGYCFSEDEFEVFTNSSDQRPKTYVLIDKELAEKLSGFSRE